MQTVFALDTELSNLRKLTSQDGIMLTRRDYELINYITEMKFSELDVLYRKFFKTLKSGEQSKSNWWAKEAMNRKD